MNSLAPNNVVTIIRRDTASETLAQSALSQSGYSALACVECAVEQGVIRLTGRVSSYYLKQLAQSCVSDVLRGLRIENRLAVEDSRDVSGAVRRRDVSPARDSAPDCGRAW